MDVNEIEVGKVCLTDAPLKTHFTHWPRHTDTLTHFTKYKLHDRPILGAFSAGVASVAARVMDQSKLLKLYDHAIFTVQ